MNSLLPVLTLSFALAGFGLVPATFGHDDKHKDKHDSHDDHGVSDYNSRGYSSGSGLRDDVRHVRGTYNHVQDELASYGSNKHIRSEMGHINAEIDHVDQELAYRDVDPGHIREELAHIHDELHHVEDELHQLGDHQSDQRDGRRGGGFTIQVR